jgi:23S rRNA (adenine-N6)-dimethyltransferase
VAGVARRSSPSGSRAHGRHFLRSRRLVEALVADAGIGAGDLVLDLGAGAGALTRELARRTDRVRAIELDAELADGLRRRFDGTRVSVVQGDATRLRWPREPFKVVANVPFDRTTAILRRLLDDPAVPLVAAELVVEWDVAVKRAAVWPSTFAGAYWGAWYRFALVRRLPRCAFAPEPSVDAGVLRIERRPEPLVPEREHAAYRAFVKRGFATGRPAVPPLLFKRLGRDLGFAPSAGARDLDPRHWAALYGRDPRGPGGRSVRT